MPCSSAKACSSAAHRQPSRRRRRASSSMNACELAERQLREHRLDRADRRPATSRSSGSRGRSAPSPRSACRPARRTGSPACPSRSPASTICFSARRNGTDSGSKRSDKLRVAAVGRHDELEQVVGADRDEIDRLHQLVELPQQRRHLDHRAELEAASADDGAKRDRCRTSRSMISRACAISPSSVTIGSISCSSRPPAALQQRADLRAQQARPVERQPDRAPAQRRVLLLRARS